jgi:hypothetical protein
VLFINSVNVKSNVKGDHSHKSFVCLQIESHLYHVVVETLEPKHLFRFGCFDDVI